MIRDTTAPSHPQALAGKAPPRYGPRLAVVAWTVLAVVVLRPSAAVGSERLSASVDRTEATLEDQIRLTLTVVDAQGAKPRLPSLPEFEVQGTGQMNQINMVNGRTTTKSQFNYLLAPKRTGTFTIPPATVEIEGRTFQSEPITVRIVEAPKRPQQQRRAAFVTAEVSTREPYVGQQVIYTWRFLRRVPIADPRLSLPELEGFVVEDLGEVNEYQATLDGLQYQVSEFRKALFPQEEGPLTVPATSLQVRVAVENPRRRGRGVFEDFFGRTTTEPRVLRTPPLELTVRPLPAPPPGFSGLVGNFQLESRISKQELHVGESATLTYTISGQGNVQMISEPKLPEIPAFKIYDDKPTSDIKRLNTGLSGAKSFRKALVPVVPGEIKVPSVSLTYFDVESGSYRSTRSPELALHVLPGKGEEELRLTESMAPTTGKVAVRILADDILPVHKDLEVVDRPLGGRTVFFGGLLAPPLFFAGLLLVHRRRERHSANAGLRRRRGALKRARKALSELKDSADPAATARSVSLILRSYIGDKLDLEGGALTPVEAAHHLRRVATEPKLVTEVEKLLTLLDGLQYGAARSTSSAEPRGELEDLLPRLEEHLP